MHIKRSSGFTIVELLIVVVVIAILAAITIVAYNGITQRTRASVAQNALNSTQKKLAIYALDNNEVYPTSLAALGLTNGGGVTYQFNSNNTTSPAGYCITATSDVTSYYFAKNFTYTNGGSNATLNVANPTPGVCPGHAQAGVAQLTNLVPNPNIELNESGYGQPNSSVVVRNTTRAYGGTASLRVTMPIGTSGTVGVSIIAGSTLGSSYLQPNSAYTVSGYVYVPTGTIAPYIAVQGSGYATRSNPAQYTTALKDQWVRLHNTFTTSSSGTISVYFLNSLNTTTAGTQFWVDNVMITENESATPPVYADGNSPGWVWNGATNASNSTGPAL